ncbi:MAG: phospholipid/cholesterol/gamma-HCH transport system substrate-binding protein [Actinomycetota bacterium]|jgi:phospholipid/cholesterol/gamma-HCH transport system substrate-binding protein
MRPFTDRQYNAVAGLIFILVAVAVVVLGGKIAYGATDPVYHLQGTFSAAGQGLLSGSDVKIHGVNIGKVSSIKLVKGRALIRLTIHKRESVPTAANAVIRPKTLFGEKFVDIEPGPTEATGPFLKDGGTIRKTQGGFEVERILTDLYPILKEIKPEELSTILDTLARSSEGVAPNVNHALHSLSVFANGQANNVAETERFIDDMALLSDTLNQHADEAVALARDAHEALPSINAHAQEFTDVLKNTARLTGDVADVLEHNQPLLNKLVPEGAKTLNTLDAQKQRLPAVVTGLRQFFETLAEAGTGIPFGDGALAKIKLVFPGGCNPLLADCSGDLPPGTTNDPTKTAGARNPSLLGGLRAPSQGGDALRDLVAGLVD